MGLSAAPAANTMHPSRVTSSRVGSTAMGPLQWARISTQYNLRFGASVLDATHEHIEPR